MNFRLVDEILKERGVKTIYFDEVQIVEGWELYVRGKLDEGFRVVVRDLMFPF